MKKINVIIEKIKNGWDVVVVNNLIKLCQEEAGFKSCEECGFYGSNNFDFSCLEELIKQYNKKYNMDYVFFREEKINKIKELLDEC